MRAKNLRECLQDNRASEAAIEVDKESVGETLGLEVREQATTEEGMTDGGE